MANERLRTSIAASGRDCQGVAEAVGVDPKTVERWIQQDRVPHRAHRRATASVLGKDEAFLWPSLLGDPQTIAAGAAEVLCVYPSRGAVPMDQWLALITGAHQELTLLSYAGLFLLDNHPDLTTLLAERARAGVNVRILLGDPTAPSVRLRGEEEGIGQDMQGRVRLSHRYLQPVLGTPGLQVRVHSTTLYTSIYRSDATMLVNMHMYGSGAPANPVMHLQQVAGGRLFDSYLRSLDAVWDQGIAVADIDVNSQTGRQ